MYITSHPSVSRTALGDPSLPVHRSVPLPFVQISILEDPVQFDGCLKLLNPNVVLSHRSWNYGSQVIDKSPTGRKCHVTLGTLWEYQMNRCPLFLDEIRHIAQCEECLFLLGLCQT